MKCGVKDCRIHLKEILTSIDDGKQRITLCENHLLMHKLKMLDDKQIEKEKSLLKGKIYCDICNKPAILYENNEARIPLCATHLDSLIKRKLKPDEFRKLHDKYGNIYLLHDDFYTEKGVAIQPVIS